MRKLVVAAALATLALPAHLHAQTEPAPPPTQTPQSGGPAPDGPPRRSHRQHLFISPSGEPFRGKNGLGAWFAQADANQDGVITLAEFQADAERAFKLYDANGDGVIDGFELQAYERDRVPEITEFAIGGVGRDEDGGGGRHHGGRHGGGGGLGGDEGVQQGDPRNEDVQGAGLTGAARFSLLNEPEPLLAADLNVDGKITHAEWMQATARRFAQLDKDHSGKLTLASLRPPIKKRWGG